MSNMSRLQRAFALGAACDAVVLLAFLFVAVGAYGWFYVPVALLWGIWTVMGVQSARSHAVALDNVRFYVRTHALGALLIGLSWLPFPDDLLLGGLATVLLVAASAVFLVSRQVVRPVASWTAATLRGASASELAALLRRGAAPLPSEFLGRRYQTVSLGPGRGPRGAAVTTRSFFHAALGPAVEGVERSTDQPDAWFVVEAGSRGTHFNWAQSRRNSSAEPRRGLFEVVACVQPGDPSLLVGRRTRRLFGVTWELGWFVAQDAGSES